MPFNYGSFGILCKMRPMNVFTLSNSVLLDFPPTPFPSYFCCIPGDFSLDLSIPRGKSGVFSHPQSQRKAICKLFSPLDFSHFRISFKHPLIYSSCVNNTLMQYYLYNGDLFVYRYKYSILILV